MEGKCDMFEGKVKGREEGKDGLSSGKEEEA